MKYGAQRAHYAFGNDADYVVVERLEQASDNCGCRWVELTRWMVPNSYLED